MTNPLVAETLNANGAWETSFGAMRLIFGAGSLQGLGRAAKELGATRVLLVTDPGVSAAGHARSAASSLASESIACVVFDQVEENPTTRHVEAGASVARAQRVDLIVGLGGGSAMDCARGINFLVTNGGRMEDYKGTGLAAREMLPSIGVPTTAGTGSEAQSYALIEEEGSRRKMACGDPKARFRVAILDSDLTATVPRQVAAVSGLDAVSHTVESFVSTRGNPVSRMLSREAWKHLSSSFGQVLSAGSDERSRGRMLLGAHLAGAAVEASMLGAAHACANPVTSSHGVAHGAAVLLFLPHVIRFNEPIARGAYDELLERAPDGHGCRSLDELIERMREEGGLPRRLRDVGVDKADLPALAAQAADQWTVQFNPRAADRRDLQVIYEAAY